MGQSEERSGGESAVLGRYEVLTQLASGGMAHLYVGRRHGAQGFQRLVVIKRMRAHLLENGDLTKQFADEARIAALIQHPNVVSIHDVHEERGELFLVMDYIDGASLSELMREARKRGERVGMDIALRIVVEALRGLHAAHELHDFEGRSMSVVHRDATPANILIGKDGSVRITDFGIAKAAARESETQAGFIKGKLSYMAPEQALAQNIDRRVDVFAMGIVLWELLLGRSLFAEKGGNLDALRAIVSMPIAAPRSIDPAIPGRLDAAVLHALSRDRDKRFPTAAAFADELEAVARDVGGMATPTRLGEIVTTYCLPKILERETRLKDVLGGRASPTVPLPPSRPQVSVDVATPEPPATTPPPPPRATALGTVPMRTLADDEAEQVLRDSEPVPAVQPVQASPAPPPVAVPAQAHTVPLSAMQAPPRPTPGVGAKEADPFAAPAWQPTDAADEEPRISVDADRAKRMRTIVLGVVGGATLLIVLAAILALVRSRSAEEEPLPAASALPAASHETPAPVTTATPAPTAAAPSHEAPAAIPPTATTTAPPEPPVPTRTAVPREPPPPSKGAVQPLPPPPANTKPKPGRPDNIVRDSPF